MKSFFAKAVLLCSAVVSSMSMYGAIDPAQLNRLPVDQRYQIKNMYSQIRDDIVINEIPFNELIARLNNNQYLDRVGMRLDTIKNRVFLQYILSLEESIEQKVQDLRQKLQDDRRVRNALSDWFNQENQAIARSFGGS